MNLPEELKYTKSHEWVRILEGGIIEIGLSDFAQQELGDIVFVSLPEPGDSLKAGVSFADVESVKAVSEVYSPVTGTVKEANEAAAASPEIINESPYEAWLIRAEGEIAPGELLSAGEYKALLPQE
ncbi:MAG: glycine cleavage system protein GcvH [Treponema sp.]|jgi:glycine cleavage system H protein|nr:glycine cleavage system protein GcvH [Treponema sp.]